MATTTTASPAAVIKGKQIHHNVYVFEIPVSISGTYATATKPSFNVLTALQNAKMGISAVNVRKVVCLADLNDGTNQYTAPNAYISLSNVNAGCVGDLVTFRLDATDSTHSEGDTNTEISDSTATVGTLSFLVVASITSASL